MYISFMIDTDPALPPGEESARRKRVIRAAEELFKRVGFRAVTMEAVARDANVAKGTLYGYFKNKDELYTAVCARLARLLRQAVEHALAQPQVPLDIRLADAVIAKHRMVFTYVRGSAHAAELYSYKDAMAGGIFAELDAAILGLLTQAMEADARLSPNAKRLASALYLASADLAGRSNTAAEMENEIRFFVNVHLAGARALAAKEKRS
jgi:AcrR family transcriptional regulator